MITMMLFMVADSLAPRSRRNMHATTTNTAGMLTTPPSPGGCANSGGIAMPKAAKNSLRYCPPANGHRGHRDAVLEHQAPPADPGQDLAEGGVGVGVRGT